MECAKNRRNIAKELRFLSDFICALGDETRQQIIITLLESEKQGLRVGEIAERIHLSRPALSHHLKILKDTGIISCSRLGTMNFYDINTEPDTWQKLTELSRTVGTIIEKAKVSGLAKPEA